MRGAPVRLRCEYLNCPVGIETTRPRLSWWPNDARPAELQTGYHIQAASTPALLHAGAADLWDSGRVSGQQTLNIEYGGRPLQSAARVWWRVRCYDSDGVASPWSDEARFELGLLNPQDWQAVWIASPLAGTPSTAVPAPLLWCDFDIPQAPTVARLYVAALGAALCEINGRRVGADEPVAGWCDLERRAPYRIYDVTDLVVAGPNRLGALLGDGDYCGHRSGGPRQQVGNRPALCAQLVLEAGSGERRVIGTDEGWRWRPSWALLADRDGGEEIDGRQIEPGWSTPAPTDGYAIDVMRDIEVERFSPGSPPARVQMEHAAAAEPSRERLADGRIRIRYDFGCSLLGRIRLRLRAPAGTTLMIRYGDRAPARGAAAECWEEATDQYTASGRGSEAFEPRFALHAFRWIQITSTLEPHQFDEVVALEIAVATAATAEFRCEHRLLERLFDVAGRTVRMGLALGPVAGLPPAARWAAAGDAEAILAGAGASLEVGAVFTDWVATLRDAQTDTGAIPSRLPGPVANRQPDAAADEALALDESLLPVLWHLYRCDGNRRVLEQSYTAVQRHLTARGNDCMALLKNAEGAGPISRQLHEAIGYCYALSLATRMAGVLGRLADLEHYDALGQRLRMAFRSRFVTRAGLLVADDQLGYLLALELGLFDEAERETAIRQLERQLRATGFRPDVDLRHGALLLEVLTLEGRPDLAYQTLLQTAGASWLGMMDAGASVLWDAARERSGRLAVACIASWLQRFLLGLELDADLTPDLNAYRRMRIQPRPPLGPEFAAGPPIRNASGHLDTVHGRYECAWNISADGFRLRVRVPANCSARIILPDGFENLVVAGEHEFYMPLDQLDVSTAIPVPAVQIPVLRSISTGS
jgi:alpha-L-rhamnosidase